MSEIIQQHQELSNKRLIVDPRNLGKRLWDSLERPWIPLAWACLSTVLILIWPWFIPYALLVFFILHTAVTVKPDVLPIHLPMEAGKKDFNDPLPGDGRGFYSARGSFFIGRIRGRGIAGGMEVWASFKALTQHFLIFGTTGAGKTESIVSYVVNYLSVGSGVCFQDAKAAPKAMIQIATICRIFGRDGDFRVTNYITGLSSERRDPAERLSNDAAVFARGSAESNTQLLVSLMPPSEGDNKIFAERAVALVSAVFPALTDLRDMGKLQIDPGTIRSHMAFKNFANLYLDNRISMRSRNALQGYLESLPGYDENKEISDQPEEVTRQFGFAQAYFTRSLASLSDTYGHIYMVGQGEIDYQDAVLNGRVILTLLPSMEKSGEELSNLGKIVLTATKNGMVVGLGTVFEGSADDIVHNLPTNSDIPYGVLNDENAYMLIEGQEILNAQARGLGFGILTGTQDAPGMLENISRTTKQIMANSAFKQIMYLDDKETTELAKEFSGEANVLVRNQYERDGDLGNVYAGKGVSVEKRYRLNETAIKKQGLGQCYLMYQGKVHEVQVFNHGINETGKDPLRRYLSHWYSVRMAKVHLLSESKIMEYLRLSPCAEWEELLLMTRDESRQMLQEMNTYFSSQLIIKKIANLYSKGDSELLSRSAMTWGSTAKRYLEDEIDPPSGLLANLLERPPTNFSKLIESVAAIARSSSSNQLKIQSLADEAGLDDLLNLPGLSLDELPFAQPGNQEDDKEAEEGSGGAGGFGNIPRQSDDSAAALAAFLGSEYAEYEDVAGAPDDLPDPSASESEQEQEPAVAPTPLPEPRSGMAKLVERNLSMMPWMASEIEYSQVRDSIIETETFFNGGDIPAAERAVEDSLGQMLSALEYPKTKVPENAAPSDTLRQLLSVWTGGND